MKIKHILDDWFWHTLELVVNGFTELLKRLEAIVKEHKP